MSTIQALRTQLLQMEQRIKEIGGDLKHALWRLDELSAEETKEMRRLLEQRKQLLDDMMQPTPAEVKRLERQNERLLQLYRELCTSVNWADAFQQLLLEGKAPTHPKPCLTEGKLLYIYDSSDEQGTIAALPEDDYYGSDFAYMFHLMTSWDDRLYELAHICAPYTLPESDTTWADGTLFRPAFQHSNICYPLHVACCHLLFSVPDVMRMDYFERHVEMELYRQSLLADDPIKPKKGGAL